MKDLLKWSRSSFAIVIVVSVVTAAAATGAMLVLVPAAGPDIAYVRLDVLLDGYRGISEIRTHLDRTQSVWQQELDTLQADYQTTIAELGTSWRSMSASERKQLEQLLSVQRRNISKQSGIYSERLQRERERVMSGVMNQISDVLSSYADTHGLDLVFCITGDGSLLHASRSLDVTAEVLSRLNEAYARDVAQQTRSGN